MSQFDDAQIGVMTCATTLLEVSLSDTLRETLHADVISILCPQNSGSPAAPTAAGEHKVCHGNIAELHYTLDWESEFDCQTNVITPHPTWDLGALLILPNDLVSNVICKNTLTYGKKTAKVVQQNGGRLLMQLPNGRFIGRDLADENETRRKKVVLDHLRAQLYNCPAT